MLCLLKIIILQPLVQLDHVHRNAHYLHPLGPQLRLLEDRPASTPQTEGEVRARTNGKTIIINTRQGKRRLRVKLR